MDFRFKDIVGKLSSLCDRFDVLKRNSMSFGKTPTWNINDIKYFVCLILNIISIIEITSIVDSCAIVGDVKILIAIVNIF